MTGALERRARRSVRGGRARAKGRAAEVLAAFWLMAHGYRILGFRLRLQGVEIDLAVRRGGVLAVVEVKRRATLQEALEAVAPGQRARLLRAAEALAARHGAGGARLDLLALAPGCWPRHIPDAWRGAATEGGAWR